MVNWSPLQNTHRGPQKTSLFSKSQSHDARFSSLYFCCEHYQVLEVEMELLLCLFENSGITLLRYSSGIFLLVPFLSSNIGCIDIQKYIYIYKKIVILKFYERAILFFVIQILRFPLPWVFTATPSYFHVFILHPVLIPLRGSKSLSLRALFCPVHPSSFTTTAKERKNKTFIIR